MYDAETEPAGTPAAAGPFDPHTAEPAAIAAALQAGAAGRDRMERAAVHLLTAANGGDLLDMDPVRDLTREVGPGVWRMNWGALAGVKNDLPLSGSAAALVDLACALATGSPLAKLNLALTTLDVRNRRVATDAFAMATGTYVEPPLMPAGAPFRAVDVALWLQRMLARHGAVSVEGDTSAPREEPVLTVALTAGRGTFSIIVAYATQEALNAAGGTAPDGSGR